MKICKIIAMIAAVMMLCAMLPLGALSVAADNNLLVNGGFETGDFTGWDKGWYNPAIDSTVTHSGSYSMKTGNTASQYQTMIKSQKIAVEANTDYTVTFWYYYDGTNAAPSFYFYVKDGGNSVNLGSGFISPAEAGKWYQGTVEFNTGNYTELLLLLQNKTVNDGGVYYFDDISMIKLCDVCVSDADHAYADGVCTVCGSDVPAAELPVSFGGNSVSEAVQGLAFKFDVAATGIAIVDDTVADLSNAYVGEYKLVKMGAILSNSKSEIDIEAVYLCELDENSASYAVRIINIPEANYGDQITATPYFVIEADGQQFTVLGETQTASYNGVFNA